MQIERENCLLDSFGKHKLVKILENEYIHTNTDHDFIEMNGKTKEVNDFNLIEYNCNSKNSNAFGINSSKYSLNDTRDKSLYFQSGDILFSGYFGQKIENENFNGQSIYDKNNINPFENEDDKTEMNYTYNTLNKIAVKKHKIEKNNSSLNKYSFNDLVRSVSLTSNSFQQRKKILSSEEIELERINKEKEEFKKLRQLNSINFEKQKNLKTPLNLHKSNKHIDYKMLLKKRIVALEDNKEKNIDEDIINISKAIENSCVISKKSYTKDKSPLKICIGKNLQNDKDTYFNNMKNILEHDFKNTSIRNHFGKNNIENTRELKPNTLKVKPINKIIKKQNDISSFEDIMEKTRNECKTIENDMKRMKKNEKISKIKMSKFNKDIIHY